MSGRTEQTQGARQRTLRQAIRDRLAQIDKLMEEEPLGMVSKPHICWATDQLSILSRHVRDHVLDLPVAKGNEEVTENPPRLTESVFASHRAIKYRLGPFRVNRRIFWWWQRRRYGWKP